MAKKKEKDEEEEVRTVMLRNLTESNYNWIKDTSKKEGYTLSGFVNHVIKTIRNSR